MPREIDEDLIEATIRKVAEARAEREGGDAPVEAQRASDEDGAQATRPPVDDDYLKAAMRRVAEARAAQPAPLDEEALPARKTVDEDLIEATIRRVAEARAAREGGDVLPVAGPAPVADDAPPARQPVDEDLIEATIRRVAAQKAAKLAGDPDWEHVQAPPLMPELDDEPDATWTGDEEPLAPPPAPSVRAFAGAAWEHHAITTHDDAAAEYEDQQSQEAEWPTASRDGWPSSGAPQAATWPASSSQPDADDPIARIERTLAALVERVDAIVPIIERLAGSAESEWADAPFPRIGPGGSLRGAMRDPSPRTATAEHLEPDVIDTRPIPKPLPPIEPKRNIDLLPRTYRITVEDKRRGVDLVPLHRALLSIEGVRDMSLLSYNNGIAMVSLEATTDIEPEVVRESVSRAMAREARIETNNEHTMVVKLAED